MNPLLLILGVLSALFLIDWAIRFFRPMTAGQRLNLVCARFNRRYKHALAEYNGYLYQMVGHDQEGKGGYLVVLFRTDEDLKTAVASGKFPTQFDNGYRVDLKVSVS